MDGNAEGVEDADLVLLVTTRPTTGNTLAWAVACERDQWGRAIAGKTNGQPLSDEFVFTDIILLKFCCWMLPTVVEYFSMRTWLMYLVRDPMKLFMSKLWFSYLSIGPGLFGSDYI